MTTADKIRRMPIYAYLSSEAAHGFACAREAAAALVEAEPQAVRVKPLVWHNFDAWTFWAESTSGTYNVTERNGFWRATLNLPQTEHIIYEYDTDGTTPNDFEAAYMACQFDHEARILAAIELTPPAVDASPAPDPVSKTPTLDALAMRRAALAAVANFPRCQVANNIRSMLLMGQIDPLQGYIRKEDCLAYGAAIAAITLPADAALAEAMQLPEVKALVGALRLAANRLQRLTLEFNPGTHNFITVGEWADEALAALKGSSHE